MTQIDGMEVEPDDRVGRAAQLENSRPEESVRLYREVVFAPEDDSAENPEDVIKEKEAAIYKLGNLLVKLNRVDELLSLTKEIRPVFTTFPKAKTAKIVRTLIDLVQRAQGTRPSQDLVDLCLDCIQWAKEQKRTFLKHRVETRLTAIYVDLQKYELSLKLLAGVLKEVKQLDDKLLLVEIFLTDCRANFECENLPRAKAALTAAKTNANAIHCPPLLQADIDLWSGVLALRERDARTAFSYLYEAFEAFNVNKDETSYNSKNYTYNKALQALRCQLLCKIMQDEPRACKSLVQQKNMLKYQTHESVQALLKIASAYEERSLRKLEIVLSEQRVDDAVITHHLKELYDTFLEKNLLKILEPFSRVELSHVAQLIELELNKTVTTLSNMILDGKLEGTLDQGNGILILYPPEDVRVAYRSLGELVQNSSQCIDSLAKLSEKRLFN